MRHIRWLKDGLGCRCWWQWSCSCRWGLRWSGRDKLGLMWYWRGLLLLHRNRWWDWGNLHDMLAAGCCWPRLRRALRGLLLLLGLFRHRWCPWRRRGRHNSARRAVHDDWAVRRQNGGRLGILDTIHCRFKRVRLACDEDLAQLDHGVSRRVLSLVGCRAFPLRWLRPVFLKDAFGDPSLARSGQRVCKNATFLDALVFEPGEVVGLGLLNCRQRLARLDRARERLPLGHFWLRLGLVFGFDGAQCGRCRACRDAVCGRRRCSALGGLLDARGRACRELTFALHAGVSQVVAIAEFLVSSLGS